MTDLTERLRRLLADATPGDLSSAERHTVNETVECPLCHEGEVEASDYCNIDGKALGVQFYGIGKEFGAHERLWTETLAALPDLLTTLENLTQENARLREVLEGETPTLDLEAIAVEARAYLADAMREPSESYPPTFATYVEQGVPSASAAVRVDTAITAIAFAVMAERSGK
jgi:hypothetical protein